MISYKEAQNIISQHARSFGSESVHIEHALNRVLAENIYADRDYPPFNRSTMDGYAIRYEDFSVGIKSYRIKATIYAGYETNEQLDKGECYKIMTGAAVPTFADTVIKREDVRENPVDIQLLTESVKAKQCIAPKGEDIKESDIILQKGTMLRASTLGPLAVVGKSEVLIMKLPTVTIFSTGDEVITGDVKLLPYQIRESNSIVLASMLKKFNIHVNKIHLTDNEESIFKAIQQELDNDIIIITGGISAGDADYVPEVLEKLGIKKLIQKVAIRPGRPFWFGKAQDGPVVFALPGNPVSAQVCYKLFIETYLRKCFGTDVMAVWQLPLLHPKRKKVQLDEFFPCAIQQNPFGIKASSFNTSGDITSTALSDGIGLHPLDKDSINENEAIDFIPW